MVTRKELHPEWEEGKRRMALETLVGIAEDAEAEGLGRLSEELARLDEAKLDRAGDLARPPAAWWDAAGLPPDRYPRLELTREEEREVLRERGRNRMGLSSSVPMSCPGRDRCPFSRGWEDGGGHCEWARIRKEPVGRPCIVEMQLITDRTEMYAGQFEVGAGSEEAVDRLQCMELAEYDVYERRLSLSLTEAERAELVEENVIGTDEHGGPVYARQTALAWALKVNIKNRRDRVLRQLVATREAKWKKAAALKEAPADDHSTQFAGMMGRLSRIAASRAEEPEDGD